MRLSDTDYVLAEELSRDPFELRDYAEAHKARAVANVDRADDLWTLIFPPWRWPRWFREVRIVRREIRELRRRRMIVMVALDLSASDRTVASTPTARARSAENGLDSRGLDTEG